MDINFEPNREPKVDADWHNVASSRRQHVPASTLFLPQALVLMLCLFPCFVSYAEWHRWRLRTRIGGYEIMKTRVTTPELESDQLYSREVCGGARPTAEGGNRPLEGLLSPN
ncbi:hypothetical protein U9M48_013804 [Paspalum notatum var. saurae]|uniref:Uncharacterized protein n=1 Tax=Paspalum notatum var. saurae TaxID=547442 RepID=A0AAQ3T304_PASNO